MSCFRSSRFLAGATSAITIVAIVLAAQAVSAATSVAGDGSSHTPPSPPQVTSDGHSWGD